jgi:hypothetical protein
MGVSLGGATGPLTFGILLEVYGSVVAWSVMSAVGGVAYVAVIVARRATPSRAASPALPSDAEEVADFPAAFLFGEVTFPAPSSHVTVWSVSALPPLVPDTSPVPDAAGETEDTRPIAHDRFPRRTR